MARQANGQVQATVTVIKPVTFVRQEIISIFNITYEKVYAFHQLTNKQHSRITPSVN